ncbi:MAG: aspartate aminotransferase family protein, partial [Acidimicrobiales bacterium]|nr:aspartate aminotransferase family protein [Acidimicrobiales bacterium]
LMVATEFRTPEREPLPGVVNALLAHCRDIARLLLMGAGAEGTIIRWMPPLTVTADEIDTALAAFGGI